MTTVYLAIGASNPTANAKAFACEPMPAVLSSYIYFDENKKVLMGDLGKTREWILDSGAFTAKQQGFEIDVNVYTEFCLKLRDCKRPPVAVFSLDVIGDWRATLANTEAMWKAGVEAIPCWHAGEPLELLVELSASYPRIAVGGTVGLPVLTRQRIFDAVFSKIWPKRIHGFGLHTESLLVRYPFDSVDASSWYSGRQYGRWKSMPGVQTSWLRDGHNFRPEVEWHLDMERRLVAKWGPMLRPLRGDHG